MTATSLELLLAGRVPAAAGRVSSTTDRELLKLAAKVERRRPVLEAIAARLAELKPKPEPEERTPNLRVIRRRGPLGQVVEEIEADSIEAKFDWMPGSTGPVQ